MTSGRWNRRVVGACAARVGELALDDVEDPRKRTGRWPIQTLMSAALMGLSARCLNLSEVEDLTEDLSGAVRRRLGIRGRVPDTTMRDLLVRMDTETLRRRLYGQNKLARRRKALEPDGLPFGVVSLDGKTTATPMTDGNRYAQTQHDEDGRVRCGLVRTLTSTLVSSRAQVCLDAHPIPPRTNEMGAFPEAFGRLVQTYYCCVMPGERGTPWLGGVFSRNFSPRTWINPITWRARLLQGSSGALACQSNPLHDVPAWNRTRVRADCAHIYRRYPHCWETRCEGVFSPPTSWGC